MSKKSREGMENLILARLAALGGRATAAEIADDLCKPVKFIAPRLSDMHRAGRVRDTGQRIPNGKGRPAVLWATIHSNPTNDKWFSESYTLARKIIVRELIQAAFHPGTAFNPPA